MKGKIRFREGDLDTAQFLFAYYAQYKNLPTQQKMAEAMKYKRQAAYGYFTRLVKLGVLEKEGHGRYKIVSSGLLPSIFADIYYKADDKLYRQLYL